LVKLSRILNKSKSETYSYIGKHLRRQWQKHANTQNKVFLNPEFVVFGHVEDTVSEKEESESKNQSFI